MEPMDNIVETRIVSLRNGEFLTLDITDSFYPKVREKFNLGPDEFVSDDYVRMFLFGVVKTAVDKVENENKDT